jgi:hypothetical protein
MAWVITPPTHTPTSPPGWTATPPTVTVPAPGQGWLAFSGFQTVVASSAGEGTLTAAVMARKVRAAAPTGSGTLAAAAAGRVPAAAAPTGDGQFSIFRVTQIQTSTPQLGSAGTLYGDVVPDIADPAYAGEGSLSGLTDGLSAVAVIGQGIPVFPMVGEGVLKGLLDGLTAGAVAGANNPAAFSGGGTLSVIIQYGFAGQGTLTGVLTPRLAAGLTGAGALTSRPFEAYADAAGLSGGGQLSATAIPQYPAPAGLFGAGALSGLSLPGEIPGSMVGSGTISPAVVQNYILQPALAGGGALSVLLAPPYLLGVGAGKGGNVSPITFTDTAPAGTKCTLIWANNASTALNPTVSAKYGSVTAALVQTTLADTVTNSLYLTCFAILWTPSNPLPTGAQTVTFTSTAIAACGVNVVHYASVSTVGTAIVLSNQAAAACSIPAPSSNAQYLYGNGFTYTGAAAGNTFTNYLPGPARWNPPLVIGSNNAIVVGDAPGNGGTLTFSANRSNTVNAWGGMIVPLVP